jgi:signal transduction histidine kinase
MHPFAQAILDGTVQGEQGLRRAVQTIFDETARMARLIGNLLTLARLDAGQSPPAHEPLDLTEWLPRWLERFRPRATAQNETLVAAMEPLPTITGDAGQLEQVLANLLDNALKYNRPGGTVTVTAKKLARTPQSPAAWITIAVSDEGPGIPKEELPHLFERFYRGDQARAAPGSGLGLAIAHEIVRAHGGRIEVDSTVGHGSTFTIYLPVQ